MGMRYRLTALAAGHIPQVAALERACFSHPWSEGQLRAELEGGGTLFLVAQGEDGTVLGYAGARAVLDEGYVNNVAVAPAFRRQGVADALLAGLIGLGRGRLAFLTLEARASNRPALRLYEKHGFRAVGRRKDYYDDPKEDAILMTLELDHETEAAQREGTDQAV